MPKLSDFLGVQNAVGLKTGEAVTLGDLGEIGPDGLVYAGKTTDYAVKPNNGDQCIAQTSVIAAYLEAYKRQPVFQGDDGSIFLLAPNATSPSGLKIVRYTATDTLISSQTLDSIANKCNGVRLFKLSNGNLCAVWETESSVALKFAIVDQLLNVVVAATTIDTVQNSSSIFDAIPLSGGGFSVAWENAANPENLRFATYSNAGAVVLAATTAMTWTVASSMAIVVSLVQCVTSGNVAITATYNFTGGTTSQGLDYKIINPTTGATVKAQTNLSTATATLGLYTEMVAIAGFFAITWPDGSAQKGWVFNEAGTQQGSTYSASTSSSNQRRFKLVTDATYFYILWDESGSSKKRLTRLASTGGASATVIDIETGVYNWNIDAFYERGYIVYTAQNPSSAAQAKYGAITTGNMAIATAGTAFGTAPATTNGTYPAVIPSGDFSFLYASDQNNVAATVFYGAKYANTSIAGVIGASVASGVVTPVNVVAGAYQINAMKGSVSKAFDMTTGANIPGNKGVLFPNGTVLKGF